MLPSFSRCAIAVASVLALSSAACGGQTEGNLPACAHAVAPPIADAARVLRLDVLDLGETRDSFAVPNGTSSKLRATSYGYDLDGLCTDSARPESVACGRAANASKSGQTDGDGGIDNAFGRQLLGFLVALYSTPSEVMSGQSYLETRADGGGTLYLGTNAGIQYVLPLVGVRIGPSADGTMSVLGAVIPRDALVESLRAFGFAVGGEYCSGTTMDAVLEQIALAPDVLVSGSPDPARDCDGISIGLRFSGSAALAPPKRVPDCPGY
jgi:hypothetical protein